jgi:hypothetical protein
MQEYTCNVCLLDVKERLGCDDDRLLGRLPMIRHDSGEFHATTRKRSGR